MPPLLLELWREQHPRGHEQTLLNFTVKKPAAKNLPMFEENVAGKRWVWSRKHCER